MALTQIDRELIDNCLQRKPTAWQAFVDRYVGLFVHVIKQVADHRSYLLNAADIDDLAAEIFSQIVANDLKLLKHFRGKSSLATYLAVIARRITVREIARRQRQQSTNGSQASGQTAPEAASRDLPFENREQIEHLMAHLPQQEAQIVRAYHLEGNSYREISQKYNIPENSIGPVLTRARESMKRYGTA